jgi:hypothetical protein
MRNSPPKRDMLPFRLVQDHFTKALDETYERGFLIGRAAGIEHALQLLRGANIPNIDDIVTELTRSKYLEEL